MSCGELVIGGFPGPTLPEEFARSLRSGQRGGVILFKSNVEAGPLQVAALTRAVHATASGPPPLIGIDQEGGRVARLRSPVLELPPMAKIASWGDISFAEKLAGRLGAELAALGITVNFAPVLDVHTCSDNTVIADRAFGGEAPLCARFGVAWIRGLQGAGVLACGKHFPGHGDTTADSHLALPVVTQARERLEAVELLPFRAAAQADVAMLMTAHVVYTSLDARPATLSHAIATDLRHSIGFDGPLLSDDLEMRAIADRWSIEDAAVLAVAAGCDGLLICWSHELQERAAAALERESERSPSFRARCEQARARLRAARQRLPIRSIDDDVVRTLLGDSASQSLVSEMARRERP